MPPLRENYPPEGLRASQHAAVHPERQQNIQAKAGTQGQEASTLQAQGQKQKPRGPPTGPRGPHQYPETNPASIQLTKNLNSLTEDIQEALDSPQNLGQLSLLSLLQRAQQALLHHTITRSISSTLQSIQTTLQKRSDSYATPQTWAQKVAQIQPTMPRPKMMPQATTAIQIKMGNQKERDEVKGMSGKEIKEKLGSHLVAAIQKMSSGDIKVLLHKEQEKQRLEENQEWIQAAWPEAKVAKHLHRVLVHGVRANWDIEDRSCLRTIEEENMHWVPHIKVTQVTWMKSPKAREGQRHSTLILGFQEEQTARQVVKMGLSIEANFHNTEAYHPQQRAIQCLKCQKFGHIATYCREDQDKCGACSEAHRTADCKAQNRKCSNCRGDHPAWSKLCKYKQAALAKAQVFSDFFRNRQAQTEPAPDKEGFTLISNKKRKYQGPPPQQEEERTPQSSQAKVNRPPGKPSGSSSTIMEGRRQVNKLSTYLQQAKETLGVIGETNEQNQMDTQEDQSYE
jgi:hypothetical protein